MSNGGGNHGMNVRAASLRRMNQRLAMQFYSQMRTPDSPRKRSRWVRWIGMWQRLAYRLGWLKHFA